MKQPVSFWREHVSLLSFAFAAILPHFCRVDCLMCHFGQLSQSNGILPALTESALWLSKQSAIFFGFFRHPAPLLAYPLGLGNPKVDPQSERGQEAQGPCRILAPKKKKRQSCCSSYQSFHHEVACSPSTVSPARRCMLDPVWIICPAIL